MITYLIIYLLVGVIINSLAFHYGKNQIQNPYVRESYRINPFRFTVATLAWPWVWLIFLISAL